MTDTNKAASPEREIVFALAERILEAATNVCGDPDGGPDDETSIRFTGNEGCELAAILFRLSLPVQSVEAEPVAGEERAGLLNKVDAALDMADAHEATIEQMVRSLTLPNEPEDYNPTPEQRAEDFGKTLAAYLAAPPKPSEAPAMGWKLVPVEPTPEMCWAWANSLNPGAAWVKMLASAPTPDTARDARMAASSGPEPGPEGFAQSALGEQEVEDLAHGTADRPIGCREWVIAAVDAFERLAK